MAQAPPPPPPAPLHSVAPDLCIDALALRRGRLLVGSSQLGGSAWGGRLQVLSLPPRFHPAAAYVGGDDDDGGEAASAAAAAAAAAARPALLADLQIESGCPAACWLDEEAQTLASARDDGTVVVHCVAELRQGEEVLQGDAAAAAAGAAAPAATLEVVATLAEHDDVASALACGGGGGATASPPASSSSSSLASGSWDGTVKLWDWRQQEESVRTFVAHAGRVAALAWSPCHAAELASAGGMDGCVRLWDARAAGCCTTTAAMRGAGQPARHGVLSLAWDGGAGGEHRLAVGTEEGAVALLDRRVLGAGPVLRAALGGAARPGCLAFCPAGPAAAAGGRGGGVCGWLAVGADDGSVRLLDASGGGGGGAGAAAAAEGGGGACGAAAAAGPLAEVGQHRAHTDYVRALAWGGGDGGAEAGGEPWLACGSWDHTVSTWAPRRQQAAAQHAAAGGGAAAADVDMS